MNPVTAHAALDRQARATHAAALDRLSPAVRARLASMRRETALAAPSHRRGWHWLAATATSAVLAVALGLHLQPETPHAQAAAASATSSTASAAEDYYGTARMLDESPDLYVWLGSDNHLIAQE